MNLEAFLQRIHFAGDRTPGPSSLAALQLSFLLSVPFENYDIHWGRPLSLELDDLEDKIVRRRRGGVCYESNVLFRAALEQLGYEVRYLDARMGMSNDVGFGPACDHMVLLVSLDREYLVDVGNGQSCRVPLPLDADRLHESEGINYRLSWQDGMRALMTRRGEGNWEARFLFSNGQRELPEFYPMLEHVQTSPESHFTQHRLATRALVNGRVTLRDGKLIVQENGKTTRQDAQDEAEEMKWLKDWFGIQAPTG